MKSLWTGHARFTGIRRIALAAFSLLFVAAGAAFARPQINTAKLQQLAEQFEQRYEARRGPEFEKYVEDHGLERYVDNVHNGMELIGLDEHGQPIFYMIENANAAETVRADELYPDAGNGYSLTGWFTTYLAMWDAGNVLTTHQEFNQMGFPRVQNANGGGTHFHATHVAGTIVAGGVNQQARGMSWEAQLVAYDWNNDDSEMASAAAGGKRISNHSYGYPTGWAWNGVGQPWSWHGSTFVDQDEDWMFGYYDNSAQSWDQIAYNNPYFTICVSAGNDRDEYSTQSHYHGSAGGQLYNDSHAVDGGADGYDCLGDRANGKNLFIVGAVNDLSNYIGPGSVNMTSFSSWGPTDDGRIKPDIVGNGTSLTSCDNAGNASYWSSTGTSMSSPNVAGTLNLLFQLYTETYGEQPLSATLKAVVLHTADEAGPWDGPDYRFGWGLMNALAAADQIALDEINPVAIQEQQLSNGEVWSDTLNPLPGIPLRATLMWTDPPASPLPQFQLNDQTPRLINDLDLRVIEVGSGSEYFPYVLGGLDDPEAPATTGDNVLDNIEQVYIEDVPDGQYIVQVSHKATLGLPQDFSVVISGAIASDDPRIAVQDLEGNVDYAGGSAELTWTFDDPGPTFQHFEIYRDGEQIGTTEETSYSDPFPDFGTFAYEVRTVWDEGESFINPSIDLWFPEPVASSYLSYTIENEDEGEINLLWEQSRQQEMAYDDGVGEVGLSFNDNVDPGITAANRITAPGDGAVYDLLVYLGDGMPFGDFRLHIFADSGDPFEPGESVWQSETLLATEEGWYEYHLADRYFVGDEEDFWVGFEWVETGHSQLRVDNSADVENHRGAVYTNMFGDWEWYPMAEFLDGFFDGDLLIRANIGVFEDVGDYGLVEYNVYRDGEMIGTTDQEQFLETLPGTDVYEYTVESVYQQGAAMSDPIEVDGNNLGVEEIAGVPSEFSIGDAYPNPFNPSVTVPVTLGAASDVRMLVYDVLGREVATVHAGKLAAGGHTMSWTADGVASGVYFLRIDAGKVASTQKVVLMR